MIWKVVLPKGSEVKGTLVGETRPTVLKGAKIRDPLEDAPVVDLDGTPTFWRFTNGPSCCSECIILGTNQFEGEGQSMSPFLGPGVRWTKAWSTQPRKVGWTKNFCYLIASRPGTGKPPTVTEWVGTYRVLEQVPSLPFQHAQTAF